MLIIEDSLKLFFDDKFKITKAMFLPLQYIYELDTVITDIKYNQSSQIESITNSINDSNFETLKFVYVDSTNAKWILFRKRKRKANFELSYSGDLLWAIWDILYFRYYIQVQL
jgi:hypothetical protein